MIGHVARPRGSKEPYKCFDVYVKDGFSVDSARFDGDRFQMMRRSWDVISYVEKMAP